MKRLIQSEFKSNSKSIELYIIEILMNHNQKLRNIPFKAPNLTIMGVVTNIPS